MPSVNSTHPAHGDPAGPCLMVIFGASGDLTKRLLTPAIYNLAQAKLLPENFAILGFAVDDWSTETLRENLSNDLKQFATQQVDEQVWNWLKERIYYVKGDFQNDAAFDNLKQKVEELEQQCKTEGNRLFYFAVAPRFIEGLAGQLNRSGLSRKEEGKWRRIIVEKPFGHDLPSAVQLNKNLGALLDEDQIFRIDHYLGKETVQNLSVFRFSNSIFEPIWNRSHIDHVQITAAETVGVEHRGGYYETAGALRDMVPNHLAQLVSLTAMEPPVSFDADSMRSKQAEVLQAIQPITHEQVSKLAVRGQYGKGEIDGQPVPGYREEEGVKPDSNTETFVAMKVMIDNWRWADVPFYLRTGKRLQARTTEIMIQFRRTPFMLFRDTPVESLEENKLLIRIQPDQGIFLRFGVKAAGPVTKVEFVDMDFCFSKAFSDSQGTGYERLLHDCMLGDQTLFQRADMVDSGWKIVQPLLDVWGSEKATDFPNYAAGSPGPQAADKLLRQDGRQWRTLNSKGAF
jgi:glucose-6-phosphate 1-dehydrogenase